MASARTLLRLAPLGLMALAWAMLSSPSAWAQPAEFRDADLKLGEKLIAEHRCSECHIRRVGGNGNAIYKPKGRINKPAALLAMVQYCATELSLDLFPEDVQAVSAVLNRDHYRFK